MIDTPNKLITLRFVLGYSQGNLAEALDRDVSSILKMERSKTHISKSLSLALEGLLYEQTDKDGGNALRFFNSIDPDKAVEFWLNLSGDRAKDKLPRWRLPECFQCSSKEVEIIYDPESANRTFAYACSDCGHESEFITSTNLARRYEILKRGSLNIYNKKWYSISQD